tara:strand:+ start:1344 stop:1727 length:384 start_codon:yes stop_codon:yes gene_type:complete
MIERNWNYEANLLTIMVETLSDKGGIDPEFLEGERAKAAAAAADNDGVINNEKISKWAGLEKPIGIKYVYYGTSHVDLYSRTGIDESVERELVLNWTEFHSAGRPYEIKICESLKIESGIKLDNSGN